MRYPIIITPDERLRRQAKPVKVITDELVQLLDDLYETMVAHDGIGIAAPQVGKNLQVAIVEVEEDDRFEMINPEIIASSGESLDVEGCLSIPTPLGPSNEQTRSLSAISTEKERKWKWKHSATWRVRCSMRSII